MSDTTEKKPCPFCGEQRLMHLRGDVGHLHWVFCPTCRADGPVGVDWGEAQLLWNNYNTLSEAITSIQEQIPTNYDLVVNISNRGCWVEVKYTDEFGNSEMWTLPKITELRDSMLRGLKEAIEHNESCQAH